jgi:hypothetical protein
VKNQIQQKLLQILKNKSPKTRLQRKIDKFKSAAGIYAAVLSTLLTINTLYEKFAPKHHELEVFAADINPTSEYVEFTVAYFNSGDFNEVLSKAELFLAQKIDNSNVPLYWNAAACNEPLLIRAKETVYQTYRAKINFSDKKYDDFRSPQKDFNLYLGFDFLSKESGRVHQRFPISEFTPYKSFDNREIAKIRFLSTKESIDFNNARPVIVYASYPRSPEYDDQYFCGKKI